MNLKFYILALFSLNYAFTVLSQNNIIPVTAGENQISMAFETANPGDILELISDGGIYIESTSLTIDKDVTIRSQTSLESKPIWKLNKASYQIVQKASLILKGIIFEGVNGTTENTGSIATNATGISLTIEDCNYRHFNKGYAINGEVYNTSQLNDFSITGCIFSDFGGHAIYLGSRSVTAPGSAKRIQIKNSTFHDITGDAIYVRDHDGNIETEAPEFIVDHCTFYNITKKAESTSTVYGVLAHYMNGAVIKNCIASAPETTDNNAYYIYGEESKLINCLNFNVKATLRSNSTSVGSISSDPRFVDAASGNFQLYENSPAILAGNDGSTIGDPRWGVVAGTLNEIVFIKRPYSMSPSTSEVTIMWQTVGTEPGVVEYGTTEMLGSVATLDEGWNIEGEGFVHLVKLTGLEPFTTYYYRVGDGTLKDKQIQKTKTAPETGTDFRIVSLSDIHENHRNIWKDMGQRILNEAPDVMITIGDLVNHGDIRDEWDAGFFLPGEKVLSNLGMISVVGNHETYRGYTTHFDYFCSPSRSSNLEDPLLDPKGQAYYSMNYGDVKIIAINANGDDYSPSFATGSPQLNWLDNEINTATNNWIFIFSHVNTISSSYHGQWSAEQKEYLLPLFEKYAAEGKRILVFGGDEHNFEHLYKSGINYIRPGAANASLREQYNMTDLPFSLYFNEIAGFSTIDVTENGSKVILSARDTTGAVFYTKTFTLDDTRPPVLYFTEPNGINDETTYEYRISWSFYDTKPGQKISLYCATEKEGEGQLIVSGIEAVEGNNNYDWDTSGLTAGTYYVYAVVSDGTNPDIRAYSNGKTTIIPDLTPPPSPLNLSGVKNGESITFSWQNPTRSIHQEIILDNLEGGIEAWIEQREDGSTGLLEESEGYSGKGLKISYNITASWNDYGGSLRLSGYPDYSLTPTLTFWYKGDGSSRYLRIIAKQDNDQNGKDDDWWYNETLTLSSNEWKQATLDLSTFTAFSWKPNSTTVFNQKNMFSIDFVVPSATPSSGHTCIDEVKVEGDVVPAPDYIGSVLVRRTDRYAENETDGEKVYSGANETCTDIVGNLNYYYTIFAYDKASNYSSPAPSAFWKYDAHSSLKQLSDKENKLNVFPNPVKLVSSISFTVLQSEKININLFNSSGQKLAAVFENTVEPGSYEIPFRTDLYPEGIYYLQLFSQDFCEIAKVVVSNHYQ